MKKRLAVSMILISLVLGYGIYKAFFDTNLSALDNRGTLTEVVENPFNNQVEANVYIIDDGGATVRPSLRISITSVDKEWDNTTVFWDYPLSEMENSQPNWIAENTFEINNHQIDITEESTWYNWKNE